MEDDQQQEQPELTEEEIWLTKKYRTNLKFKLALPTKGGTSSTTATPITTSTDDTNNKTSSSDSVPKRPRLKVAISGLKPTEETVVIYDPKLDILSNRWDSRISDKPLLIKLENIESSLLKEEEITDSHKNTVLIYGVMPTDSQRFSINLSSTESIKESDPKTILLYHFNPRDQPGRQTIFQNSLKDTRWSLDLDKTIKGFPIQKEKQFELRLTICLQGIAVYLDGKLVTEFINRYGPIPSTIYLYIPIMEESYQVKEKVIINRIWYGYTIPYVPGTDRKRIAFAPKSTTEGSSIYRKSSINTEDGIADRTLFITGLPTDGTARDELKRLFEHYQLEIIDNSPCIYADNSKGHGFVKLQNSVHVSKAISYLHNTETTTQGEKIMVTNARKKQVPVWFKC